MSIYNIGCVIGALSVGRLADGYGRERTISLASIVFVIGAFIQTVSYTLWQMVSGTTCNSKHYSSTI